MGKLFLPTMLKVSWSILSTASTDDYTEIVFDSVVLVVNICSQPQMDPSDKKKDGTWDLSPESQRFRGPDYDHPMFKL